MPVVGYNPPNEKPQDLAFFSYGCCVSTTQALWMVIGTFTLAVVLLVACFFSAIFVRWVYKRRMRKKLEGLKDKYRQEEKFKKEVEMNLKEIAKRPIIRPQKNEYIRNIERSLEQLSTVNVHGTSVPFPMSRPSGTNLNQPSATNLGQQVKPTDAAALKTESGGVVFTAPTMAGVVHQMAMGDMGENTKNSQPPFPGIAIKQNVNRSKEETKVDTSNVKKEEPVENKLKKETVENKVKQGDEKKPSPNKRASGEATNEKEGERRKGRRKRAAEKAKTIWEDIAFGESEDDEKGEKNKRKEENQGKRQERKSAEADEKTRSTQSSPADWKSKRTPTPDPTYSVYHLRKIAEEQRKVAEMERAKEMLGERQTTGEKRGLDHKELERLMKGETAEKQTAAVMKTNDVPDNEDSPSRR